ncbi:MAG: XdhC/CoxI family protein [Bacteroidota bacterium]
MAAEKFRGKIIDMKELLPAVLDWVKEGTPFALATVTHTWGSSPRPIGSVMAISGQMDMLGSVSGGCIEGAVVTEAMEVMADGLSRQLAYGVTNEDAWSVGLSCGGKVEVFVEQVAVNAGSESERTVWASLWRCLANDLACIWLTRLAEGEGEHVLVHPDGRMLGERASDRLKELALQSYQERKNQIVEVASERWFVRILPRRSQLLIIGAAHVSVDLVRLAQLYDFETIVIDPRKAFLNKTVFPVPPDQLIGQYPDDALPAFDLDAHTYAAVLSHDPKIDDPAFQLLLRSQVAYIGGLGSRKTQAKRKARLLEAGFTEAEIDRIHGPIGLDIRAKTAGEIALSILAEIIRVKNEFA